MKFDFIVTNPPWGSKLSKEKKEKLILKYPELKSSEVFSVALRNCRKMLVENGELHYFLPYAFLNVRTHKNIRKYILNDCNTITIKLLGHAFEGVFSEAILLKIKRTNQSNATILIEDESGKVHNLKRRKCHRPTIRFLQPHQVKMKKSFIIFINRIIAH